VRTCLVADFGAGEPNAIYHIKHTLGNVDKVDKLELGWPDSRLSALWSGSYDQQDIRSPRRDTLRDLHGYLIALSTSSDELEMVTTPFSSSYRVACVWLHGHCSCLVWAWTGHRYWPDAIAACVAGIRTAIWILVVIFTAPTDAREERESRLLADKSLLAPSSGNLRAHFDIGKSRVAGKRVEFLSVNSTSVPRRASR
jgi:hypothetical protein